MNTFEGVCRYCGSMVSILADSQEEADELVTRQCTCEASELEKKKARLMENIKEVCTSSGNMRIMDQGEISAAQIMARWIFEETITGITISFSHSNIRVWESGEKIKVKRTAKVEETREA